MVAVNAQFIIHFNGLAFHFLKAAEKQTLLSDVNLKGNSSVFKHLTTELIIRSPFQTFYFRALDQGCYKQVNWNK